MNEAQWLSGSASRFHNIGPRLNPWSRQGQLGLSSLQWVDKGVPSLLGVLRQTDHLTGTSAHAPQDLMSRTLK
ncbi:hypothetical protein TNCV_2113451 [Trichonephila clavipes]|nr:hypothetical protein TNCV_2113451 [Trichonephila clavipes]